MGGVELAQTRKRSFQCAAHPSKRRGLFLDDLIVEDIDRREKITGHGVNIAPRNPYAQRADLVPGLRYFARYAARNIRVALSTTAVMRSSAGGGAA